MMSKWITVAQVLMILVKAYIAACIQLQAFYALHALFGDQPLRDDQ